MKKTIWAHTIVKNEERFLWYGVISVIDHVDKILLWDTGSTDNTIEIATFLQKKYPKKIEFREYGEVDIFTFTKARQEMLDQTESDWFMILDGDEVWWKDSIKMLVNTIQEHEDLDSIVSPYYNCVGDIYHYQEQGAAKYLIDNQRGFINIRAVNRKISKLHFDKPHGQQGLYSSGGKLIQNLPRKRRIFLNAPYMHFTNIIRSSSRENDLKVAKRDVKLKFDFGIPFPKNFKYPEVFYQPTPEIVPNPWERRGNAFTLRSFIETPLRYFKRRLTTKVGY